jgi:hypothetical protein
MFHVKQASHFSDFFNLAVHSWCFALEAGSADRRRKMLRSQLLLVISSSVSRKRNVQGRRIAAVNMKDDRASKGSTRKWQQKRPQD